MSDDGFPSMTALLGLLAIAGYQHRDKIAEVLGGLGHGAGPAGQAPAAPPPPQPGQQGGGLLGGLGGLLSGLTGAGAAPQAGSFLNGGIGQLVNHFDQNGQGDAARSWIGSGPNQTIAPTQLEQAIGPDVLATLTRNTGLSRDELLARLSSTLPHAVDQYTPGGRVPT